MDGILLIFTDGSAIPNPGYTGYGIHMAIGVETDKPKNILDKYKLTNTGYRVKKEITTEKLTTYLFKYGIDIYGYVKDSTTNNTAELDAVIRSIDFLPLIEEKIKESDIEIKKIVFLSDSMYVLGYMDKILNDNLNIDTVVNNVEYIKRLNKVLNYIKDKYEINIEKVKAHTDDLGNNRADMLANMGRLLRGNKAINIEDHFYKLFIEGDDFWKEPKVNKDIWGMKQLFNFYNNINSDNYYYGLNYKKETEIGKPMPYITYTVIKTDNKNKIIEDIFSIIRNKLNEHYVPYIIRLSELFNKNVLRDYFKFKNDYLIIDNKRMLTIKTVTDIEIARELYPPSLSVYVMDKLNELVFELDDLEKRILKNVEYIDITDKFYTENDKGKYTLNPEFKNDKPIIKISHPEGKISLKMKYDMPSRNSLKRLEKVKPTIYLVLHHYTDIIRYNTILITNEDDKILTSNVNANVIIKKKRKTS